MEPIITPCSGVVPGPNLAWRQYTISAALFLTEERHGVHPAQC